MTPLQYILISTSIVSLISLIGILIIFFNDRLLQKILFFLVSLAAGVLIGNALLDLIPESLENSTANSTFLYVLLGFITFFLLEKLLHWHHCHKGDCNEHTFAYINLLGDSIHNFIDGFIISASFITNTSLGIITTITIILHEIPQELSDFGVLIYGGFTKAKALAFNFLTALTSIIGGLLGYYLSTYTSKFIIILPPIAAGGFIYIAASDLIPELKKETDLKASILSFVIFLLGILMVYLV